MLNVRDRTIIIPDLFIIIKLLEERPKSATEIQFEARLNYSHVHIVKRGLVQHNLITIITQGREKYMNLTEKGTALLKIVNEYLDLFNIEVNAMTGYRRTSKETTKRLKEEVNEQINNLGEDEQQEQQEEQKNQEVEQNDDNQSF